MIFLRTLFCFLGSWVQMHMGSQTLEDKCKKSFQIGKTLEAGCCEILFSIQNPNCLLNCRSVTIAYARPFEIWCGKKSPFTRGNNGILSFGLLSLLHTHVPRKYRQPSLFVSGKQSSPTPSQGIQLVALEKLFSSNNYFLSEINCILGSNLTCGLIVHNWADLWQSQNIIFLSFWVHDSAFSFLRLNFFSPHSTLLTREPGTGITVFNFLLSCIFQHISLYSISFCYPTKGEQYQFRENCSWK